MAVKELEAVPWLVPEDMCTGKLNGPDDTHSLWGWNYLVDPKGQHGIREAVYAACEERFRLFVGLPDYNNYHTNAENARLWNKAMRSLKYYRAKGWMVI